MGRYQTGFLHHVGTFLLLVSTALLIVTTISAPVVDEIALLRVNLDQGSPFDELSFGTFGYCEISYGGRNRCSNSVVGYSPANVATENDGTPFSEYAVSSTDQLTKVMILHPIATGLMFIAFVMALSAGVAGSLLASLVALLAFVITLVALVCDFVLFSVIRSNINEQPNESFAYYSVGMWTLVASAVCAFLGAIVVFLTCCSGRRRRSRDRRTTKVDGYVEPPVVAPRRRRFPWQRRARY